MARATLLLLNLVAAVNAVAVQHHGHGHAYDFKPELATSYWNPDIPILFNFSDSQFSNTVGGNSAGSSYWTSSYITATTREQYLAISHVLIGANNETYYRASVLALNDPTDYNSFIVYTNETALAAESQLRVTVNDNGFQSLTEDNVSQMRTYSNNDKVTFDITYNATSPALVDAATGLFTFGTGKSYEWGFPNCYTEGTLLIDGKLVTIDPANSFTWYDRQWNDGFPENGNWTWFELHIPNTEYKLSIWAIDNAGPDQRFRFATVRAADGSQIVVPITFSPDYSRSWYSNATATLYAQDWTITIGDFAVLRVSSLTENQEIIGKSAFTTAYEGFVTFDGRFYGRNINGFGVVEVLFAQ